MKEIKSKYSIQNLIQIKKEETFCWKRRYCVGDSRARAGPGLTDLLIIDLV